MTIPIVAFGEIVWDQFDNTEILGGAPLNVAYHLHKDGWSVQLVSRVGQDELGSRTLAKVADLGLPVTGIQLDTDLPTGRVFVTLDAQGEPSFEIETPASWDAIQADTVLSLLEDTPFYLVFGTLAQRSKTSENCLSSLLNQAEARFYDVNLRLPYTGSEQVLTSLVAADVVKTNREELMTLAHWFQVTTEGDIGAIGRAILSRFDLSLLAITDGARGAMLMTGDEQVNQRGIPVKVVDPVGSGDAFFAALIGGYLSGLSLEECLSRANRQGAWVASCQGATPAYP